ncbi:hypothetical protein N581_0111710 [Lactobacillus jensenii MD IIE-70(2)]|jgi:hypothetical protein|nr:hypothetical protein N581_0111710 [Lactobacillus jensenii MD IIE-70(2)]
MNLLKQKKIQKISLILMIYNQVIGTLNLEANQVKCKVNDKKER